MKKQLRNKSALFTIFFLCVSWVLLVIMRTSDVDMSFSVLANRYGFKNLTSPKFGEYVTGEIIKGEFTAKEDNLGIVSVRLNVDHVVDADKVIFRLKEKGSGDWYYENRYRITRLPGTPLFPFGFPVINNSRGRAFLFEIEVPRGVPGNALQLDATYPVFNAHYKFYKKELLKNPRNFVLFLVKKAAYYFSNRQTLTSSFVDLLIPLTFWAGLKWFFRKLPIPYAMVFLALYLTLYETLYVVKISETIILILTGTLLVPLLYLKLDSRFSFVLAFAYLLLTSVLFFIGEERAIQISAVWAFIFLLIGLVQSYWELNHRPSRDKSSAGFFDGMLNTFEK